MDDEEHVRNAARFALEWYGYSVWTAEDGRDALRRFEDLGDRICIVLLDLTMPVMDGVGVLKAIRERRPELPVVVSSGYSEEEAMARFGNTGATAVIQKPYLPAQLAAKLKAVRR